MYTPNIQQKVSNIDRYSRLVGLQDTLIQLVTWPNLATPLDAVAVQSFLHTHEQDARSFYKQVMAQRGI